MCNNCKCKSKTIDNSSLEILREIMDKERKERMEEIESFFNNIDAEELTEILIRNGLGVIKSCAEIEQEEVNKQFRWQYDPVLQVDQLVLAVPEEGKNIETKSVEDVKKDIRNLFNIEIEDCQRDYYASVCVPMLKDLLSRVLESIGNIKL